MPAVIATASPLLIGLEAAARRFAAMDRLEADAAIDAHVATAIREWRVADATLWQRVRFRSRMIRSTDGRS
ncbi:hypothetical protein LPN01_09130 [Sphingomonas sp. A2-49]|uniref:hypothetical protein n=1 Tax=Sphingomonas sp. A2-49 TaxID=1391375 RepID=UPI0021D1E4A0|nr:hypothetical protein [Sphingomonas sp. A2-49]MCU6454240.1 hypothetical protein [Sphingomonas sp. A2-49]